MAGPPKPPNCQFIHPDHRGETTVRPPGPRRRVELLDDDVWCGGGGCTRWVVMRRKDGVLQRSCENEI